MRAKVGSARSRVRIRFTGTVQGVGFRPFVYRLARELALGGWVQNDARGVVAEVEGSEEAVRGFVARVEREAPPLAVLERVSVTALACTGAAGFEILASAPAAVADAPVTPDSATCADCLGELADPSDRRYRYPFINCTNCGPRFTIVRGIPYDRPLTTMAAFAMCACCRAEYEDPGDRRFHAQPNACPECGPHVSLVDRTGAVLADRDDAVRGAVSALRAGAIVAVKGLGGYHLGCLASSAASVAALRSRKHREDKPFALLAADLEAARRLVALDERAEGLLQSPARPIVLAPRRPDAPVAPAVAPGVVELGVMLPYSPLHHLLVAGAGETLVMTSGNVSDEPIAFSDHDARERLREIADLFVVHDRAIETRTDDSVVRVAAGAGRPAFIRRSRGYVPASIPLPVAARRPLLACGAELKNTFCVARGGRAWVSHHVGDLENYATLRSFEAGIEHFQRLFSVIPEVVVHDLHPEYLSSKHALAQDGVALVGVQHHHAHLAACLAEHGEQRRAVGAIFDGTGYGTDGAVWGGEILSGNLLDFARVGHLRAVALPGGAQAIRQPWRMACAWLLEALGDPPRLPATLAGRVDPRRWRQVSELARTGLASPPTTSMGRLFDAVAALCGIRPEVNYEGQAAIELEATCDPGERRAYPIELSGELELDPRMTIVAVVSDLEAGRPVATVAARFHAAVARATVAACAQAAAQAGTELVVLSGGVFANQRLLALAADGLARAGLQVLVPEKLPGNDGGVSYGQAAVAAARLAA